MNKISTFSIPILLLVALSSFGQTTIGINKNAYIVDKSIKATLNKKVQSFNGITITSMDIKMFENDSTIVDTYKQGKSFDECIMMTSLDGDTINITGFYGMFSGFGYQIELYNDTCVMRHIIKSDAKIYKLRKNDPLTFGLSVPCETYKLTLVNKPNFKKGDTVEGIVELTSEEYYESANGNEKKYKIKLTGYFKTQPLESKEDKYKKLKSKNK